MMLNRVSLNTIGLNRIGLNRIGKPSRGSSDRPYIDPEVLASLKAVCICYGKSNDDPDRAIVKNLVDPDNPFVISNAAFKLNSGFGKYETELSDTRIWTKSKDVTSSPFSSSYNGLSGWIIFANTELTNSADIPSFKIEVKGLLEGQELIYRYYDSTGQTNVYSMTKDGEYTLPADVRTAKPLTSNTSGFQIVKNETNTITITQIPSFEGAFVTDGIDDLITSTKTAEEMGITDEVTVVSMIHQINANKNFTTTNNLRNENRVIGRNTVTNIGKTGIYGWYKKDIQGTTATLIDNILGDKNDYTGHYTESTNSVANSKFYVTGYAVENGFTELSSVAWYWNFISNKYLTTDQINQVIAYFNLDRTLKSDIYCNIAKQGITNENHTEFGDRLIDFSGNGRDIQLNNIAWDGDSGIGKYNYPNWKVNVTQGNKYARIVYYDSINGTYSANFKGITDLYKSYGLSIEIRVNRANTIDFHSIKEDGIYTITPPDDTTSMDIRFGGEDVYNASCNITITQIPSYAGALCLDGVNDFGQFVGDLGLKDYTLIMNRAYNNLINNQVPLVSSNIVEDQTPFIVEHWNTGSNAISFSYGASRTTDIPLDINKKIVYQSTYSYMGYVIPKGNAISTGGGITLGKFGNGVQYSAICLWSLMLFPYSMSEFLIERQLKKYKLGTLYPDMVEFRPIIKQDDRIKSIKYYIDNKIANIGQYYPIGTGLGIAVETVQPYMVKSLKVNGVNTIPNADYKGFNARLDSKSPQKITMDIVVDTSIILFNPTINSNAVLEVGNEETMPELFTQLNNGEIDGIILYMQGDKAVLPNNWIDKNTKVRAIIYCLDTVSEEDIHFTVDGKTKYCYSVIEDGLAAFGIMDEDSQEEQYMTNVLTANTIDIQLDQYIRYEDIVQPYPVLLRFNDENGNEVSWGGKFRVGSTITRIGSFYENNLIDGLYIVRNPKLNGNNLITPTHVVEKSMVFTCDTEYLLDNNEPKCILSPSRLRIPNSSYKILGYIPDISGHGNHGVIHNSAYAGASGANGYLQNFSGWTKASGVSSTDSVISSSNNLVAANGWIAYVTSGNVIPTFKVEISGIPVNGNLRFEGSDQVLVNGVNTIQGLTTTKVSGFYISNGYDNDWSNLRIEQIGEYEGAYCLDGVDDFVTIPTLSSGGKQVLMKVNWSNNTFNEILYDQRENLDIHTFAIFNHDSDTVTGESVVAYNSKNNGNTYIDGILNYNIKASELKDIEHNITITNESVNTNNSISPTIGTNKNKDAHYAQMALYDFMLFDNISTDDKIKELNEYVGIEAKVELPPYYWDAYGKTNLDEDKNYTANLGTVKDVIEVSQPAIFAENWYDGNPEPVLSSPIINQTDYSIEVKANKMDNNFTMMLDVECDTPLPAFKAKFSMVGTAISVNLKYYINGGSKIIDVFKSGGSTEPVILDIPASERSFIYGTNTDNYPNILIEVLPADNGTRYGLTNTNFAYDKMSGYGGYSLGRFDKSWSSSSSNNTSVIVVSRNPYDITLKKLGGNSDWEFNNTELKVISNPVSVKFKSNKNIRVTCDYHYYPVGGNSEGTPLGITSKDLIANKDAIITISPISQENIDKYNIDVNRGYYLIYFQLSSTLAVNEEVTIEMLPLYPNGLVYDGVTDYSENANIPALTDYTYIFKREFLSKTTGSASMYKGEFFANGGMAFIADYAISDGSLYGFSYRGQAKVNSLNTDKIIYGTKTSVNGSSITPNTNIDTAGLTMGKFDSYRKMVFYKLILYPKTIPLLQINFLKNLMERDEIIDLNNKIFIQE